MSEVTPEPHRPRRAPPWWPENEPWPPAHPEGFRAWRRARGRFLWRIGIVVFLIFFIAVAAGTTIFWWAAHAFGLISTGTGGVTNVPGPPWWRLPPIGLGVVVLVFVAIVVRSMRSTAMPVADLMEAARRVEAGDYDVHVHERGPREVREMARAFNEMVGRLRENDEQRRNMLADVTHELRTPLTVIQGNLEGLLDGVYPRDDEHLTTILDETRVFARLVEDLRTLAQAESGTLVLRREPTEIAALVRETVASFTPQADAAGVGIATHVNGGLPALDVDPARIRAVLSNLLTNALRYTPAGGTIDVTAQHQGPSGLVRVSVADTGGGIPAEALPHIFDRFYKSSDSGGSGLGLAIARHLVLAHGGDIKAESEPGQGTRITFTLPTDGVSQA